MEINVKKITIISRVTDTVYLDTDLPEPIWPFNGCLTLQFEAVKGKGAEYVRKTFGREPDEIVDPQRSPT